MYKFEVIVHCTRNNIRPHKVDSKKKWGLKWSVSMNTFGISFSSLTLGLLCLPIFDCLYIYVYIYNKYI